MELTKYPETSIYLYNYQTKTTSYKAWKNNHAISYLNFLKISFIGTFGQQ